MSVFSPSGVTLPSSSGDNADLLVSTPTVQIINLVDSAVEYTATVPSTAKRFKLKTREDSGFKLAYTPGETLLDEYLSIGYGFVYEESNLSLVGALNIYLRANKGSVSIELIYWS